MTTFDIVDEYSVTGGAGMTSETLIFLHIPKASGTTMRSVIEPHYGPDQVYCIYEDNRPFHSMAEFSQLDDGAKAKIRAVIGHVNYGLHRHLPNKSTYCALMRDPVARVISYYHHRMCHHPDWNNNNVSLLNFLSSRDPQTDNHQTRILSGVSPKYGACTDEMLWSAVDNINSKFCLVGLVERFDESLLLLGKLLGWSDWNALGYAKQNVSINKPREGYFSQLEINTVKNHNRLDVMLYSYVRKLFEAKLKSAGGGITPVVKAARQAAEADTAQPVQAALSAAR
jgi:hypothetical protein